MKGTQPNSYSNQTNRTVENNNPKLKIYNFSQEALNLELQSMLRNLTPKIWYVGAIRVNKPIQYEKVNILT